MPQPYDIQLPDILGQFQRGRDMAYQNQRRPVEDQQRDQAFGNAQDDRELAQVGHIAGYLAKLSPEQRAVAYQQVLPKLAPAIQKHGLPAPPPVWDESHLPELEQIAGMFSGENPESWSNGGNGFLTSNRGNFKQIPGFADARPNHLRPIMVPDGKGGQVQMLFDPSTGQTQPMAYGGSQEPAQRVQFDFAPGTSPEVEAATRAAAGAMDPGAQEVGGSVTQAPQTASAGGYAGMGYKPPPMRAPPKAPAGAVPAPGNTSLSGDAYLASLPPEMRGLVKAIAAGDSPAPSASSRSPQAQALLQAVYLYDPSASSINLNARGATRRDFTAGKSAQNLRSLNQAIGHLGVLRSQIGGVAGHSIPGIGTMVNKAENAYDRASGKPGITNYEQTAEALAGELTQVFRGNAGAEADIVRNLEHLSSAQSVEQKNAAVRNIVALLNSRIEELGQQYSQGMGKTTDPYSLLNKHAAEVLKSIRGGDAKPAGPKVIRYDNQGNRIP